MMFIIYKKNTLCNIFSFIHCYTKQITFAWFFLGLPVTDNPPENLTRSYQAVCPTNKNATFSDHVIFAQYQDRGTPVSS